MISLKTAYYYFLAVKINFTKFFKKIYFTTGFYKKSLITKVPNQFFCSSCLRLSVGRLGAPGHLMEIPAHGFF